MLPVPHKYLIPLRAFPVEGHYLPVKREHAVMRVQAGIEMPDPMSGQGIHIPPGEPVNIRSHAGDYRMSYTAPVFLCLSDPGIQYFFGYQFRHIQIVAGEPDLTAVHILFEVTQICFRRMRIEVLHLPVILALPYKPLILFSVVLMDII